MSSSAAGGDPGPGEGPQDAYDRAAETALKALRLAEALGENLAEIARRLGEYSAFGRRSRRVIIGLAVSFALDVILTVVLAVVALQTHGTASVNSQQGRELHASQLTACANGNVFRDNQTTIWRDFVAIITKAETGQSAAQVAKSQKLAAQFLAYVTTVNHPVDCAALYGP
jgi:hypothetical protein